VRNGRKLDDFIGELLRHMIKTWLDENLPAMVERLVRAEIERVSRGRG
jgi:cell pole-organizing protein PopZ